MTVVICSIAEDCATAPLFLDALGHWVGRPQSAIAFDNFDDAFKFLIANPPASLTRQAGVIPTPDALRAGRTGALPSLPPAGRNPNAGAEHAETSLRAHHQERDPARHRRRA